MNLFPKHTTHKIARALLASGVFLSLFFVVDILKPGNALGIAEVLIDASVSTTDYGEPGAQIVWTTANNGYIFYKDSTGATSMASTTNGGLSWASRINIDTTNLTDTISVAVWWDGWTGAGTTTTSVHISTLDTGVDDTYYTTVNLTTGATSTTALGTTQGASATAGANYTAITRAENGVLYMASNDITTDAWVVSCSTTCTTAGNWSERTSAFGTTPDLGEDPVLLSPQGGNNNIMLIYWDTAQDTLDWNVYSATSSTWWFTAPPNIATSKDDNTSFEGQMIGLAHDGKRGFTYVALVDDANDYVTADHDINVFRYATTTGWTTLTNPVTDATGGLSAVKIGVDRETGHLIVAYIERSTIGTATTGNVFYKTSTDGGTTWSSVSERITKLATGDNLAVFNLSPVAYKKFSGIWKYDTAPNADDLYHRSIWPSDDSPRSLLLFNGARINFYEGRIIIHQK